MGLDMYLTKKHYIGAHHEHRNVTGDINITIKGKPVDIKFNRVSEISEEIGYWRKANQIHNWFVKNVQDGNDDCREYPVSMDRLMHLFADVTAVLSARGTPDESKVIGDKLPPVDGFFFGSTDIDEWYWENLEDTKKILTDVILESKNDDTNIVTSPTYPSFYYNSSW